MRIEDWESRIGVVPALVMSVAAEEPSAENDYGRAKLGGNLEWESLLQAKGWMGGR